MTDDDALRLRTAGFSDQEIVDIAIAASARVYLGRMLQALFGVIALTYAASAAAPGIAVAATMVLITMMSLGLGNGVVFQLVPLRFPREIGIVTGLVGAAGGVGGFLLPTLMGAIKQSTGAFAPGFVLLAVSAATAAIAVRARQAQTQDEWSAGDLVAD